jgi:uncharacterized protein (TIGR00295 family)
MSAQIDGVPDSETCLELLKNAGCKDVVIIHCGAVAKLALEIGACMQKNNIQVNMRLIEAGALLHDIGRAKTNGIMHAVEGTRIARDLNLPDKIIFIIRNHIGAGVDKIDAMQLKLPPGDYTPKTLEEKIVAHADNLIDIRGRHPVKRAIDAMEKKGEIKAARRIRALHEELSTLCGKDLDTFCR